MDIFSCFILFKGHYLEPFRPVFKIQNLALTEVASTWQELGSIITIVNNVGRVPQNDYK